MQLNATPKRALKGKTPYFIVFGRQMNSHPVSPALREDLEIDEVLDDEWQDAEGVSPADLPYPGGNSGPISSRDGDLSPPVNRDDLADDDNVVFLHKSTCPATKISTLDPHDDKDKAPTLPSVSRALFNDPDYPVLNDKSLRSHVIERVAKINIRQGGLKELHKKVREYKPIEEAVGGSSNTAEEAEEESITAKTTGLVSAALALAGSIPR
ncbi:hypothetical protein GTA08_BOTSDO13416 [Botryosphaeria dothidea]|uniref:Uncharacterized protein n=1 Tax=Botryosphaeria dothidea TaxID=55169 RepID=A0A8H4J1W6_9PEZI|nr:hypothetical protein GTA08_BOTSDO13416 [Botryosphaeria dothidea]